MGYFGVLGVKPDFASWEDPSKTAILGFLISFEPKDLFYVFFPVWLGSGMGYGAGRGPGRANQWIGD